MQSRTRDLTTREAQAEANRRWGTGGIARELRTPISPGTGRLARYRFAVGDGATIDGQGDTWREAFQDASRASAG
jgi:hypothetical protein